jgi:hypothetical protein
VRRGDVKKHHPEKRRRVEVAPNPAVIGAVTACRNVTTGYPKMKKPLSKLERVPLREAWRHECFMQTSTGLFSPVAIKLTPVLKAWVSIKEIFNTRP